MPAVMFSLTDEFKDGFYQYTLDHLNEKLDLMQDDRLIISATINDPIPQGRVQISGGDEDKDSFIEAVTTLRNTYLPCPFEILSLKPQ